jgi:hypothetical protein
LPQTLVEVCEEQHLQVLGSAGPGIVSVALKVWSPEHGVSVLKYNKDKRRISAESACVEAWATAGLAPRVHWRDMAHNAYMLAHVEGEHAREQDDDIVIDALYQGWRASVPEEGVMDRLAVLLPRARRDLINHPHPQILPALADRALALYQELNTALPKGVCHGDPYRGNTLISGPRCWLIDPMPHRSPLEALICHWAVVAREDLGKEAQRLAKHACELLGHDANSDLLDGWLAIHAVQLLSFTQSQDTRPSQHLLDLLSPLR